MTRTKRGQKSVASAGIAAMLLSILSLLLVNTAPRAEAAEAGTYATVDGHRAFTAERNQPENWVQEGYPACADPEDRSKDDSISGTPYSVPTSYALVVVKAGSGEYANTIFEDVAAGEQVWADTNGNGSYDPGGRDGDASISHIIFCGEPEPEPEPEIEISPIVECAVVSGDVYTIYWGYENRSTLDGEPYTVSAAEVEQSFTGGSAELPTEFGYPGVVDGRPGRTAFDQAAPNAFVTTLTGEQVQVWTLDGRTATASADTKQCPGQYEPDPDPTVRITYICVAIEGGDIVNDDYAGSDTEYAAGDYVFRIREEAGVATGYTVKIGGTEYYSGTIGANETQFISLPQGAGYKVHTDVGTNTYQGTASTNESPCEMPDEPVIPALPTTTNPECGALGTVVLPETEGITYTIKGDAPTYRVVATADEGFVLDTGSLPDGYVVVGDEAYIDVTVEDRTQEDCREEVTPVTPTTTPSDECQSYGSVVPPDDTAAIAYGLSMVSEDAIIVTATLRNDDVKFALDDTDYTLNEDGTATIVVKAPFNEELCAATPAAPTLVDSTECQTYGSVAAPADSDDITYGITQVGTTYTVVATPDDGVQLDVTGTDYTLNEDGTATTVVEAPFNDEACVLGVVLEKPDAAPAPGTAAPAVADEVVELADTGVAADRLSLIAVAMLGLGAWLLSADRRRRTQG